MNYLEDIENTFYGPLKKDYLQKLYGGDERFRDINREKLRSISASDVRDWVYSHVLNRSPEIVVVGEFEFDEVTKILADTFGGLKCMSTPEVGSVADKAIKMRSDVHEEYQIDSDNFQPRIRFYWPAQDKLGKDKALLAVLNSLFEGRFRNVLREKLSVAYTPEVRLAQYEYPWLGEHLILDVSTEYSNMDLVRRVVPDIMSSFEDDSISMEELERARNPLVEQLELLKCSTPFLLGTIPKNDGNEFCSLNDAIDYMLSRTPEDLTKTVLRMFHSDKYSSIIVR